MSSALPSVFLSPLFHNMMLLIKTFKTKKFITVRTESFWFLFFYTNEQYQQKRHECNRKIQKLRSLISYVMYTVHQRTKNQLESLYSWTRDWIHYLMVRKQRTVKNRQNRQKRSVSAFIRSLVFVRTSIWIDSFTKTESPRMC